MSVSRIAGIALPQLTRTRPVAPLLPLRQVAQQFEQLREEWWTDVDASQSPDDVAKHVLEAAMAAVQRAREGQPLRALW
jgi:hypothetical protein